MSLIIDVTEDNFKETVLEEEQLVLLDFYTDGCGPCEAMEPVLKELSEDYEGKVKIAKFYLSVDDAIDRKNKIAVEYDLMGFPTFYLFKNGEVQFSVQGTLEKEELVEKLDAALK